MIKNLIFDIGGVLLEYRWLEMFAEFGVDRENTIRIGRNIFESETWADKLDKGLIDRFGAIEEFRKEFPEDIDVIEWFMLHPERMPVGRPEIWEKADALRKKGYKVYLLSNYSQFLLDAHTKGTNFRNNVDGEVISYQVGLIKPDPRIYQTLLDKYGLIADECLFFDDREKNVKGAEALGIHGFQVSSRALFNDKLDELLNS